MKRFMRESPRRPTLLPDPSYGTRQPGTPWLAPIALILLLQAIGCASVSVPTATEIDAAEAGRQAIVLLRVICTVENEQPYEPFRYKLAANNVSFYWGSFRTGGIPDTREELRFLSTGSRKDGWTYFMLPSGTYYLMVIPPGQTGWIAGMYEQYTPRWRLDVPESAKLVYAGTLHLIGRSERMFTGEPFMKAYQSISVTNEHALAAGLASQHFPSLEPIQVELVRRHEGSFILHAPLPTPTK